MPDTFGEPENEVLVHFNELYKLMWAMTWDCSNGDYWLLEPEEMFAELSATLVHVVGVYGGNGKSHNEMKRILIVSLRNRCADLCAMAYNTHRHAEVGILSLDDDLVNGNGGDVLDETVSVVNESSVLWSSIRGADLYFDTSILDDLSDDARTLVDEVLHPGERLGNHLELAILRRQATCPANQWSLTITPLILRRAVGWDMERFTDAWDEVAEFVAHLDSGLV